MNIAPNIILTAGQAMPAGALPSTDAAAPDAVLSAADFASQWADLSVASPNPADNSLQKSATISVPIAPATGASAEASDDIVANSAALVAVLTGDAGGEEAQPVAAKTCTSIETPEREEAQKLLSTFQQMPVAQPKNGMKPKANASGKAETKTDEAEANGEATPTVNLIPGLASPEKSPAPTVNPAMVAIAAKGIIVGGDDAQPAPSAGRSSSTKTVAAKAISGEPPLAVLSQRRQSSATPIVFNRDAAVEHSGNRLALPLADIVETDSQFAQQLDLSSVKVDAPGAQTAPFALRLGVTSPNAPAAVERELDLMRNAEWLDRLARDIVGSADKTDAMSFRLRPARLGQLDVSLTSGQDGLSVQLATRGEEATRIVAAAQPRLIENLQAHGVKVAEARIVDTNQTSMTGAAGQTALNTQAGAHSHSQQSQRPAAAGIEVQNQLPDAAEDEDQVRHSGRFA